MKKSFVLYTDTYSSIKDLSLKDKGSLLDAIFQHAINGSEIPITGAVKMAFNFIKASLDRDAQKWEVICRRNTINGKKGGRPRLKNNPEKPKKPSGYSGNPKTLDSDSDSDIYAISNDIGDVTKKPIQEGTHSSYKELVLQFNRKYSTDLFPTFGKQAASIKKILQSYSIEDLWACAEWLSKNKWWKDHGFDFTSIQSQISKYKMSVQSDKSQEVYRDAKSI